MPDFALWFRSTNLCYCEKDGNHSDEENSSRPTLKNNPGIREMFPKSFGEKR